MQWWQQQQVMQYKQLNESDLWIKLQVTTNVPPEDGGSFLDGGSSRASEAAV